MSACRLDSESASASGPEPPNLGQRVPRLSRGPWTATHRGHSVEERCSRHAITGCCRVPVRSTAGERYPGGNFNLAWPWQHCAAPQATFKKTRTWIQPRYDRGPGASPHRSFALSPASHFTYSRLTCPLFAVVPARSVHRATSSTLGSALSRGMVVTAGRPLAPVGGVVSTAAARSTQRRPAAACPARLAILTCTRLLLAGGVRHRTLPAGGTGGPGSAQSATAPATNRDAGSTTTAACGAVAAPARSPRPSSRTPLRTTGCSA